VGGEKAGQIQTEIQGMLQKRDPFLPIRSVDAQTMASVLETEHPQAAAVVLSELSPKKSSEVIGLLGDGVRVSTISRMTSGETVTAEAKVRIAEMVCRRLGDITAGGAGEMSAARPEESLRKVAVILRNLGKEVRDGLVSAITEKDADVAEMVGNLMIIWEDIPQVVDRSLQEALRGVDAKKLALALTKADEEIAEKIKSNISERAAATVDEEASLMSAPKKEDIEDARTDIVRVLREMNEKGELAFVEE
jgi:flagellar motor switch protein FliG